MPRSDAFRNLLAGPVQAAAHPAKAGTVRAWVANNGLQLGDRASRQDGAFPRHTLADAARLLLMSFLTYRQGMKAQIAADVTNAAASHIDLLAESELAAIDEGMMAVPSPRYVLTLDRTDGLHNPTIAIAETTLFDRGPVLETRVELRELVRLARDRLCNHIGVPLAGLPHDFAPAVAG